MNGKATRVALTLPTVFTRFNVRPPVCVSHRERNFVGK